MKNLSILFLSFAICAMTSLASAADLRVATADMSRLYDNYHRAAEARKRLQSSVEAAENQARTILEEREAMVEEYQKMLEDAESPALSAEARERAQAAAEEQRLAIQEKEHDFQQFQTNTRAMLEQQNQNHQRLMFEEIREVVREVAAKKGATLVLNSAMGGGVIYSDSSFDITEETLEELNKDQQ
ncbi:MAG TPA: OmpH family outer membrane protein [Opitutales bacterium]|nr:OmpH family outer membrane protein [Opitutales bacterium]